MSTFAAGEGETESGVRTGHSNPAYDDQTDDPG